MVALSVDGEVVATKTMARSVQVTLPWDETFDVGSDTGKPIDDKDYQIPFAFTGNSDLLIRNPQIPRQSPCRPP